MSRSKVEGTKIAQAAKDLNVTSVTIRRYIQEFDIETATDENGIKVLPVQALAELQEIRKLKEDGLTNPKVLEHLEEMRTRKSEKPEKEVKGKGKATRIAKPAAKSKAKAVAEESDDDEDEEEEEEVRKPAAKFKEEARSKAKARGGKAAAKQLADDDESDAVEAAPRSRSTGRAAAALRSTDNDDAPESEGDNDAENGEGSEGEGLGDGDGSERSKHTLVCQTCSKTFEHMNPRLRDCLDCYRAKRKERRRGGDKHKNVIQNPIAQQVVNKAQQAALPAAQGNGASAAPAALSGNGGREGRPAREPREYKDREDKAVNFGVQGEPREPMRDPRDVREPREPRESREPREVREPREARDFRDREPRERVAAASAAPRHSSPQQDQPTAWAQMQKPVRSYRKAIEETRLITGSLKRRLERPDLPEGERRWLEQIYAYQLILHQGWRHLSEYKSGSPSQAKQQQQAQEEAN
ncbi:MAG: MerR family transcriptional regulator [Cyanobacteria bacterium REEB67]|nr:MerR family transcriptional regulator [Cyanobacteria bacterium REEB67]